MATRPHDASPANNARPLSSLSRSPSDLDLLDDDDDDDRYSSSSGSSKRRRCSGAFDGAFESDLPSRRPSPFASCASGTLSPLSDLASHHARRPHPSPRIVMADPFVKMNTTPPPSFHKGKQTLTADYEDWENLKELFARAIDRYDGEFRTLIFTNVLHFLLHLRFINATSLGLIWLAGDRA